MDATVGLPLIVAAVLERLGKSGGNHKGKKEKALAGEFGNSGGQAHHALAGTQKVRDADTGLLKPGS